MHRVPMFVLAFAKHPLGKRNAHEWADSPAGYFEQGVTQVCLLAASAVPEVRMGLSWVGVSLLQDLLQRWEP